MILYAAPSSSEIIIATNAKGSIEFTDLCKRETEIQLNLIVKAGNSLFQTQGGKPTIRNNGKGLHGFNEPWCYGGWLIAALFLVGVCGYYFWLRKKKNP